MGYPFGDGHLCFGGDDQLGLCHVCNIVRVMFYVDFKFVVSCRETQEAHWCL